MIPRLLPSTSSPHDVKAFLARLVELGFDGDIETAASVRTVFATDNSIYQVEPSSVIFPTGTDDLMFVGRALAEPRFRHMVIAPRGGGTGTNGQSLTPGVVVDCSRHMNRILEIDPVRRVARVQSGVVKDQLNRELKKHGLFFAPELSTSNRATIGGMISTDACGQGSCLYGKTSNHVLGLRIVLTNGDDWWSRPLDEAQLLDVSTRTDRIGEIYRTVNRIVVEKAELIEDVFPKLNRYMTGYDLAHVRRDGARFDLNSIICGSEGTLAFIAEAELNLLPIPECAALLNIRYDNFNAALADARTLLALNVASVETIDEKVLGLAKGDIVWNGIAKFFPDDQGLSANGINIVEVLAGSDVELTEKLELVTTALESGDSNGRRGYTIAKGHADVESIWSMRKRAVGLLGNVEGPVRPVAFVEDTAVPPENLAAYIREFRALLDAAGVSYGMFGHVDAGVLHVRPALDLANPEHVPLVREISDAVVELTRKYGGVLWGEHGKGVRSEYVPQYFGALYPALQDIKQAFDPENRLNPGKIAGPASKQLLKIDEVPLRGDTDRVIGNEIRAAFDNGPYCNGNGACFDFDETSPMCPSFKATGDRRFSPKGRAALMREWLRLLGDNGVDPRQEAKRVRSEKQVAALIRRTFNSLNPANRGDFSHEVRAAMDTCLACKACAGQCPVKVSVPAFRSKFLELYYDRYLRPIKDPIVGSIEAMLPWMARVAPLYNLVLATSLGRFALKSVGLTALPKLASKSLYRRAREMKVPIASRELLSTLTDEDRRKTVVFLSDAFTAYFNPDVGVAAIELARRMGLKPLLAEQLGNGKALHVHGYLARFAKVAEKSSTYLRQIAEFGIPVVGLDPSMSLVYRSEYKGLNPSKPAPDVLLPQEWLIANLDSLPTVAKHRRHIRLLPHCTERTNVPASGGHWRQVFQRVGIDLEIANTGCCGMAGTFGHEVRNRATSKKLFEMSWEPELRHHPDTTLVATGYSCRSQVAHISRTELPHPLQVLAELLN